MNITSSLRNLNIKLQQKNILFITGNVYETFIDLSGKERKIGSLIDKIKEINKKSLDYDYIEYFTLDQGSKNILDPKAQFEEINLVDFLNQKLIATINDKNQDKSKMFIVDFGDIFMDNSSAGKDGTIETIMKSISSIINSQTRDYNQITNNAKLSKLIFIMRESGNIINYVTNKNIEYSEITIHKPDLQERKKIFEILASRFNVKDREELIQINSKVQNSAAAITDGMSWREILQLARIVDYDEEMTFKELFYLSTLKNKKSIWEQLDISKIKEIEEYLNKKIYGQEEAIKKVGKTIKRSFMGLAGSYQGTMSNKPKGILFYCGPTGVGKTEMAKSISEFVFDDPHRLVRFDMSEFSQEHSDQRLLGAPPGYIGFDSGGELTNVIKDNPNSIILFDEIEKSHPKILDKFLQILEDGRLTSSKGELINFSETFIIFTSNIGSSNVSVSDDKDEVRKTFLLEVEKHFINELKRPELLNRIGKENIIPFNFINDKNIQIKMFESKLQKQNELLKSKYNISLKWENDKLEDLLDILIDDASYNPRYGGRGLLELATKHITDPLVEFLFENYQEIINSNFNKVALHQINIIPSGKRVSFSFNK